MSNELEFVTIQINSFEGCEKMPLLKEMNLSSSKKKLQEHYFEMKKDPSFQKLIHKLELSDQEAMKITSKLQDTLEEVIHCKNCKGMHMCQNSLKGHVMFPEKKEGCIYFSYAPCQFQKAFQNSRKEKNEQANANCYARMKDIDMTGDKKRMDVIKWIDQFFSEYEYQKDMKGIYLYGSFGSGKTFLVNALFHELELSKHASILVVYFPEALRNLKEDWDFYDSKMRQYQTVDLLLLDDIGAEKVTEWGRDEVLGTILQYRMEHRLPTFFTSNMNLNDLEKHLAETGKNVDTIKARRIIERIKQLSVSFELISENRRK